MQSPCKNCLKKGCGAYHDVCPDFTAYKADIVAEKKHLEANGATVTDADMVLYNGALKMRKITNQMKGKTHGKIT